MTLIMTYGGKRPNWLRCSILDIKTSTEQE